MRSVTKRNMKMKTAKKKMILDLE